MTIVLCRLIALKYSLDLSLCVRKVGAKTKKNQDGGRVPIHARITCHTRANVTLPTSQIFLFLHRVAFNCRSALQR